VGALFIGFIILGVSLSLVQGGLGRELKITSYEPSVHPHSAVGAGCLKGINVEVYNSPILKPQVAVGLIHFLLVAKPFDETRLFIGGLSDDLIRLNEGQVKASTGVLDGPSSNWSVKNTFVPRSAPSSHVPLYVVQMVFDGGHYRFTVPQADSGLEAGAVVGDHVGYGTSSVVLVFGVEEVLLHHFEYVGVLFASDYQPRAGAHESGHSALKACLGEIMVREPRGGSKVGHFVGVSFNGEPRNLKTGGIEQ
jgi:hypothetical protein